MTTADDRAGAAGRDGDAEIARRPGRSHPPSLMRLAERAIQDEALVDRGDVVLCACSGGPDSTALLHVLGRLRQKLRFEVAAHGVDHGLRAAAAEELAIAERVAASLGVPFGVTRVHVAPGGNLQARAREARLGALRDVARRIGAKRIATGHTADDRAETVLLRLLRGAGPSGLAALPPAAPFPTSHDDARSNAASITLIRPLFRARRVDVAAHLARHHIAAAQDPSNADPRFLRVRVRRELLPLLVDMSPAIVDHLCALADMLAAPDDAEPPVPGLGRAQRLAVARAKKCERDVKLRLSGGRDVVVGFSDERAVLIGEAGSEAATAARRPPR
ncbi:MAG: tRNA lysidine(34) synthetase TilS [Polyangiaceae bacterium]